MSPAKPVIIGTLTFSSRSAAIDHVSTRMNSYATGARVTDSDDLLMLGALVTMHADPVQKIGSGISFWTVESNTANGVRSRGFHLHRTDGTVDDFGYVKIIRGQGHVGKTQHAMANAVRWIHRQVRNEAFDKGPVVDAKTGDIISHREDAKVVHTIPRWRDLCDQIAHRFGGYDQIKLEQRDGFVGECLADPAVEQAIVDLQNQNVDSLIIVRNPNPEV